MNEIQEKSKNSDVDGFDVVVDCSGHPAALKQVALYSIQTVKEAHVSPPPPLPASSAPKETLKV
jgi:hypothetical protein